MENSVKKNPQISRAQKIVFRILLGVYGVAWTILGIILLIWGINRGDRFKDFSGEKGLLILIIVAIICGLSLVYLMFIKNKWVKYAISYALTILFAISFFILMIASHIHFISIYTKEKWIEYPQYRDNMLEDLKENYELIGMDEDGVIMLLGNPDTRNKTIFAYYVRKEYKDRVYIEIKFEDGKVIFAIYRNML